MQPRADKMKECVMDDVEQAKSKLSLCKGEVASALGRKAGELTMKPLVEVPRRYESFRVLSSIILWRHMHLRLCRMP